MAYTLDDGLDHQLGDGDTTVCGQRVSIAGLEDTESTSNPCPVCFPDEKPKKKSSGKSS